MGPDEGWVGVDEVARHLQVARDSVYRWVDSKGFPAHRVGRLLRFKLSEVDEWVKNRGADPSGSSKPATTSSQGSLRKSSEKKKSHG